MCKMCPSIEGMFNNKHFIQDFLGWNCITSSYCNNCVCSGHFESGNHLPPQCVYRYVHKLLVYKHLAEHP